MRMISQVFMALLLLCCAATGGLYAQPAMHPAELAAHQQGEAGNWEGARLGFAEAAEQGSPTAMAWLGLIHEQGRGIEASDAMAAMWYARAVEAGAEHLALKLGWLYLGSTTIRDQARAEQWFHYGIARGDLSAHVALSSVLIADALGGKQVERVHQAREWLLTAHEGGQPVAKLFLTRLYLEGIGGHPLDYAKAHHYASLGAEEGHPQMQGWLAQIYKDGLGRDSDLIAAAKWAMLAAIGGDPLGSSISVEL
jgi:TPR repeat protein